MVPTILILLKNRMGPRFVDVPVLWNRARIRFESQRRPPKMKQNPLDIYRGGE
jgi:hypothetical protein